MLQEREREMSTILKMGMTAGVTTKKLGALAACALGIAGMTMTQQAQAQGSFTFTKIADTSTPNPSGGTFKTFSEPSISGTNVAFVGNRRLQHRLPCLLHRQH